MNIDILKIYSYQDEARNQQLGCFEARVNPLALKIYNRNRYSKQYPLNSSNMLSAFSCGGPNYMELTLTLDGTGMIALENNASIDVVTQLNSLIANTMNYIGNIHQPPYLKVIWGQMPIFYGRAEKCDVQYKTFNSKGVPVRADVELLLLEDIDVEYNKRQANPSSPDLFHFHPVTEKDSLPYLSWLYYRSADYSQLIATANNLNNLYDLKVGTNLLIPPLAGDMSL